jgi:anaerobic selenocysteine-containing dehydrogenase
MCLRRRDFLKMSGLVFAGAASGIGLGRLSYADEPPGFPKNAGGGQELEATVDLKTGAVKVNPAIAMRHSACLGCYSSCSNRVKVNQKTGQIMRVAGNPYSPLSAEPHLPYDAPLEQGYLAFSAYKGMGHKHRATLCARGNATLQAHYDPYRILVPLKRAGKRGEGKWQPITWEQAVKETVEGGQLFKEAGESAVIEGLRQVRDLVTPIDPRQPELGPKANQLVFIGGRGDGRTIFGSRFTAAYGTLNNASHGYS